MLQEHIAYLLELGIHVEPHGSEIRMIHLAVPDAAKSEAGLIFLRELMALTADLSKNQRGMLALDIQTTEEGWEGVLLAGPANFGADFDQAETSALTGWFSLFSSPCYSPIVLFRLFFFSFISFSALCSFLL